MFFKVEINKPNVKENVLVYKNNIRYRLLLFTRRCIIVCSIIWNTIDNTTNFVTNKANRLIFCKKNMKL